MAAMMIHNGFGCRVTSNALNSPQLDMTERPTNPMTRTARTICPTHTRTLRNRIPPRVGSPTIQSLEDSGHIVWS
jgi:hypothetical protein